MLFREFGVWVKMLATVFDSQFPSSRLLLIQKSLTSVLQLLVMS